MEVVAVERELGSGQGDIRPELQLVNSNHIWSSGIGVAFVTWYWF